MTEGHGSVTAYGLRRHLADDHGVTLRGLTYEELVAVHEEIHAAPGTLWDAPPIDTVDTKGRT